MVLLMSRLLSWAKTSDKIPVITFPASYANIKKVKRAIGYENSILEKKRKYSMRKQQSKSSAKAQEPHS